MVNSSTSGLVGKWMYDYYLKLMNNKLGLSCAKLSASFSS